MYLETLTTTLLPHSLSHNELLLTSTRRSTLYLGMILRLMMSLQWQVGFIWLSLDLYFINSETNLDKRRFRCEALHIQNRLTKLQCRYDSATVSPDHNKNNPPCPITVFMVAGVNLNEEAAKISTQEQVSQEQRSTADVTMVTTESLSSKISRICER